ncbi:aconitate hydratase [Gracilinema caldarium]|uniref:Aconitate hydratase A n=1 Tax=Gracilinema caldarium (strain ATCC 51460 / DSM 7334 / H1) TaxID=744872 RepID=F8EZ05_GRAC1|nr:aconitate hydratase [Gracilinema caldarium]AEJ19236.1 aconitate hydratase [Gracilinema caldarium DSM 7334]
MGFTVAEKIIKAHLIDGQMETGSEIAIKIDQTLTQDATGTMAYLQFESMGLDRVQTELSVSYVDHNTLQEDWKNMDDHRYLQSVAARYGIWFSRPGNGICHQVHLERFGLPGKTLLGSDSHTPTGGGLGMLAIGAGGLDVAVAMGGGAFHLIMPKIVGVHLTGRLKGSTSAKDIILELLRRETVKGGVGTIYEYFGEGVASLSVTQRATICNMGAELGATTSLFPSDEITKQFLDMRSRGNQWLPLQADPDAQYARIIEINLDTLQPMIAQPHSPDNVIDVASITGIPVDQVVIGSCTNSSLEDLAAVASIVKGKVIDPRVSAGITPGSRTTLLAAEKAGILGELIRAGFRILESACGPCIGMGFAPKSGGISLRTFNRNFEGRSGTADARVYLCSPETAAAAALTGQITNPNQFTIDHTNLDTYLLAGIELADDGMLIPPVAIEEAKKITIERGPNIKPCPSPEPIPDSIQLPVLLKTGDNISTDDIMPAGAKVLPLRSNIPEISKFVFTRLDPDFWKRAKEVGSCIIVGGNNYGQGSSREHAALAPMYLGVKAVLVKSYARIHKANLVNYGILPLIFIDPEDYHKIDQNDQLELAHLHSLLETGSSSFEIFNKTKNLIIRVKLDVDDRSRRILRAGGLVPYTRSGGN